jgi:hypothetical protein
MKWRHRISFGAMALALCMSSGCYGPFNLTRRLYQWNGQVGTTWEREFMFILLAWAPVYSLAFLGDAVVFNSMEFWTGSNPVDPPHPRKSALPETKRLVRGADEALLTYLPSLDGTSLVVQQFHGGRPAGSLHLQHREGVTVGTDREGEVLFLAQSLPDGGLLVEDGHGRPVARYSRDEAERVLRSLRQ